MRAAVVGCAFQQSVADHDSHPLPLLLAKIWPVVPTVECFFVFIRRVPAPPRPPPFVVCRPLSSSYIRQCVDAFNNVRAFAKLYDKFVGNSFRVVNNKDIVARLPRATMRGISLDYCHSGRTVMVAEDPAEPPWIQGEVLGPLFFFFA